MTLNLSAPGYDKNGYPLKPLGFSGRELPPCRQFVPNLHLASLALAAVSASMGGEDCHISPDHVRADAATVSGTLE